MSDSSSSIPPDSDEEKARQEPDEEDIVMYPIEDSLDLHTFRPQEVRELLHDYLEAAHQKGLREVRIIHGKGTGTLRRQVHSVLKKHPLVSSFQQADLPQGSWGATVVFLRDSPQYPTEGS